MYTIALVVQRLILWYLPPFLYAVVTIEFQSVAYSVSEGSGSVGIVVAKRGLTTSAIIVEFSTTDMSASGSTAHFEVLWYGLKFALQ